MNIAIVGCGYVFDIYMRTFRAHGEINVIGIYDKDPVRLGAVSNYYNFPAYESYEDLLSDEAVEIVVNLTSIKSHYEVSRLALEASKHVYSEKPLTTDISEANHLFEIANQRGVRLYAAPCNVHSDSVQTMYRVVKSGEIGKPLLVYAELDDNPIHKMGFENIRSPSGAPWPLRDEVYEGCTFEHLGYHLVWICGLLGPAISVTAFSSELIPEKLSQDPGKVGTPDFSVACLSFANGASARITCSVVAPRDHRMRVIGEDGEVYCDSYRQYRAPVHLEKFERRNLEARKFYTIRNSSFLSRLFGIGGRRVELVRSEKSYAVEKDNQYKSSLKQKVFEWLRRKEVYAQDKFVGITEMIRELEQDAEQFYSPDFIKHINELTLLVSGAGDSGSSVKPKTSFKPVGRRPESVALN